MPDSEATEEREQAAQAEFRIAEDDLDELDHISLLVLRAHQTNSTASLFALYQRIKHITARTRRLFED